MKLLLLLLCVCAVCKWMYLNLKMHLYLYTGDSCGDHSTHCKNNDPIIQPLSVRILLCAVYTIYLPSFQCSTLYVLLCYIKIPILRSNRCVRLYEAVTAHRNYRADPENDTSCLTLTLTLTVYTFQVIFDPCWQLCALMFEAFIVPWGNSILQTVRT